MKLRKQDIRKRIGFASLAGLAAAALAVVGCSMVKTNPGTTVANTVKASVPISITDAPSDQVLAASLTLKSVVLTDSKGATASLLTSPLTFEATHLDAVQEPLFTPAVPEDTYSSVTLTYSNAQVAYIDPSTKDVVIATAMLANTSQTITFATPVTVSNSSTSLLIDYLVANSITISGTTVTVAPDFKVVEVPIRPHPGRGTEGRQDGVKGSITALAANNFTLSNSENTSVVIAVDANTKYEDLSGFSALAVGMLVEVDTETQSDGSLLARRVEQEEKPEAARILLVGPITKTSGSPVTTFTQVVRQEIGTTSSSLVQTDTITITSNTRFRLPGRFGDVAGASLPFSAALSAATLFPGQNVAVTTHSVTNNAADAVSIRIAPQTIGGTIAAIAGKADMVYDITLDPASWLATLTGETTVTVYTNGNLQEINKTMPAVGDAARFNGFLFKVNGKLVLFATVQADGAGHGIGPN
jgi:Domain of unknown function (DUF5666)